MVYHKQNNEGVMEYIDFGAYETPDSSWELGEYIPSPEEIIEQNKLEICAKLAALDLKVPRGLEDKFILELAEKNLTLEQYKTYIGTLPLSESQKTDMLERGIFAVLSKKALLRAQL